MLRTEKATKIGGKEKSSFNHPLVTYSFASFESSWTFGGGRGAGNPNRNHVCDDQALKNLDRFGVFGLGFGCRNYRDLNEDTPERLLLSHRIEERSKKAGDPLRALLRTNAATG